MRCWWKTPRETARIVCLAADSRSHFNKLLFRRDWPFFYAFDLLALREDLRGLPLLERKRRLRAIMPRIPTRVLYSDDIKARGRDFFRVCCERDLEGIVGKWTGGSDPQGTGTSWIKSAASCSCASNPA